MARRELTISVCDVCGREVDTERYLVTKGSQTRVVDLCTRDRKGVEAVYEKGIRQGQQRVTRTTRVGPDTAAVRAWAQARGLKVSSRGRIPANVVQEFEAAHR